jgi:NADPH:quinone reductase-like Zn-dependent oxidoreductase
MRVGTMLAARLHKVGGPMKLEHVLILEPRPTDVLVAVKACGVVSNLINVLMHWQTWFPELPLPKPPAISGLDVAGVNSWLNTGREPALLVAVMVGGR